jgi:hypothetical protein
MYMRGSYPPPQLNSKNGLILGLDGAPTHFAHIVRDCLDANFPGRRIGRGGPNAWPPHFPDLTPLDFVLWGYVKGKMCIQIVDTLDEVKARITAGTANITKDVLQHKRRTPGRMYEEL